MTADIEAQRARNRIDFPITAAIMDNFRAVFGPEVKLAYACEGGRTVGKRPEGYEEARRIERETAFRVQAQRAFFNAFRRMPQRGVDVEWSLFFEKYTAQHWRKFPGVT